MNHIMDEIVKSINSTLNGKCLFLLSASLCVASQSVCMSAAVQSEIQYPFDNIDKTQFPDLIKLFSSLSALSTLAKVLSLLLFAVARQKSRREKFTKA